MYNVLTLACHTNGLYQELGCKNNLPAKPEISTCRAGIAVTPESWHTLHPCPVTALCHTPSCMCIHYNRKPTHCVVFMHKKSATKISDVPNSLCKQKRRSSCIPFLQTSAIFPLSGSACCLKIPCVGAVCGA